jgi:hypothetical protein
MKPRLSALIVMAASAAAVTPAGAADLTPRLPTPVVAPLADVEYRITPFFWMAGLNGEIGTRRNLPTVDVDVKFGDILRNLDFAAMLAGEYRNGRWGLLADLTYVAVSIDGARDVRSRTPGFTSATLKSGQFNATVAGFYRFYDGGGFTADALLGARVWSVSTDVDLLIGGVLALSTGSGRTWVDPVVGVRFHAELGNGFGISGYGDIGAGSSQVTWQLRGTLDYRFNANWSAHIGYRHLAVDYKRGGYVFDAALSGPILGVSYRF